MPAGAKPEQMREPERGEVRGECEREGRVAEVVRHAAGDEEPRPERAEERCLALDEDRGVVGGELGARRAPKRSVAERVVVAAPRLERSEDARMAEADVDRPVPAGGEAADRPRGALVRPALAPGRFAQDAHQVVAEGPPPTLQQVPQPRLPGRDHDDGEGGGIGPHGEQPPGFGFGRRPVPRRPLPPRQVLGRALPLVPVQVVPPAAVRSGTNRVQDVAGGEGAARAAQARQGTSQ